ncbi:MAG: hypothetical protein K2M50_07275 [Treponemataceae bacterium]|nr:hypothetical protein [Treponemataceae bacterium]
MNKTIFQKISVVTVIAIIIATLFSCHPDGPEDFIDYVYDAGNIEGGNQNTNTNDWSYPTSRPQQLWSGSGASYDPYIIKTAQDLANLAYMVNNSNSYEYIYFKLDRSIDLNYGLSVSSNSYAKEWTSIGSSSYPFKGNFDGNNYTINGLYKNSLFGYIYNGSVKNLTMETGYIYTNSNYTGSIASYIYNTTISNCTNNGTIVSSSYGHSGGLVGKMESSEISNSSNYANVSSTNGAAGGIVGYMSDSSSISNSYNYATVSSSSYGYAGGIAGIMYNSSISYSYNYSDISSTYGTAGGIVGYADHNSYCSGCYNNGYVSGSTTDGIIGNR